MDLFDEFRVIDVDTHVTEPADTRTSRVPEKWKDRVPHIGQLDGVDTWVIDGTPTLASGLVTMASLRPSFPTPTQTTSPPDTTRMSVSSTWMRTGSMRRFSTQTWAGSAPSPSFI